MEEAYRTGRGKIRVRAVTNIETLPNGKSQIIVTELPYMVNKAKLIEKIADLHKEKRIDGITDLRDESNREGTRVVIELRRDANANVILNQLYKHTQMQDTFGCYYAGTGRRTAEGAEPAGYAQMLHRPSGRCRYQTDKIRLK